MIIEVGILNVKSGQESAFEEALQKARPLIAASPAIPFTPGSSLCRDREPLSAARPGGAAKTTPSGSVNRTAFPSGAGSYTIFMIRRPSLNTMPRRFRWRTSRGLQNKVPFASCSGALRALKIRHVGYRRYSDVVTINPLSSIRFTVPSPGSVLLVYNSVSNSNKRKGFRDYGKSLLRKRWRFKRWRGRRWPSSATAARDTRTL